MTELTINDCAPKLTANDCAPKSVQGHEDTVVARIDLAPVTLAFVGDAVFTLFVRERIALQNLRAGELTRRAARIVSAVSQSEILERISGQLSDSEKDIVRRCRNAHTNTHAKNASICEYRRATGLEGLIGYLHLSKSPRLSVILDLCLKESDCIEDAKKSKVAVENSGGAPLIKD